MYTIIIYLCYFIGGFILTYAYKQYLDYKDFIEKDFLSTKSFYLSKQDTENFLEEKFLLTQEDANKKWDIVYVLEKDINDRPLELQYSLRSLQNFNYNRVWFCGGQPKNLIPDKSIPMTQKGADSWGKVNSSIKEICQNPEVSENFWLFNDDFFVMRPHSQQPAYYDHDLAFRILTLEDKTGYSNYSRMLRKCLFTLKINNLPTKNYAVHMPMLINKKKALEVIEKFPDVKNFKNLYGNCVSIEATQSEDVKYSDNSREIDTSSLFLSTEERSFGFGMVGKYIQQQFPNASRFEK